MQIFIPGPRWVSINFNEWYKLAPCRPGGRLFTTDVSAKFKVTWNKKLGQISKIRPNQI